MVELSNSNAAYLQRRGGTHTAELELEVIEDRKRVLALLQQMPQNWVHSGYQAPSILRQWIELSDLKPLFLQFNTPNGPVILPLEALPDCTARYIGGRHANGNFPLGSKAAIEELGTIANRQVHAALRRSQHQTCSVVLERQLRTVQGLANPFVNQQSARSPNVALSFDIRDGFDAVLAERNGKRLRKKMRSSQRKLEELGTVMVHSPEQPDDIVRTLDRFFELKTRRFQELGIFDVFADENTRNVFRSVFSRHGVPDGETRHVLHALCLDDKPIAVIGCTEFHRRVTVEFGAFDDTYSHASPGDLLFFRAIEHYCAERFDIFDFGVGDELYKRRWCDVETWHADTFIAANLRGVLIAMARDARTHAVRAVKSNDAVWAQVKRLRKMIGGR